MTTASGHTTLICPVEHESGVLGTGPSLEYRLWHTLAERVTPPSALELSHELSSTDVTRVDDVQKALERSKYFTQTDDGKWVLSIHKKLRWGVAGCGKIAADFVSALSLVPGAHLVAVATSSSQPRAQAFADHHGAVRGFGSYQELANDSEVDVVYVATIHTGHMATALQMIAAGKHVLVEKPMCMNAGEVERLVAAATEKGVFLMEGMWSRFLPAELAVRQLIRSGRIGNVLMANAQFTFLADEGVERLMKAELGGGAMLDIGIYPLALMCFVFGTPVTVSSCTETVGHESDMSGTAIMRFNNDDSTVTMGTVQWSFRLDTPRLATFQGTGGQISTWPLQCPDTLTITQAGCEVQTFKFPHPDVVSATHGPSQGFNFSGSAGFVYEAMAVHSAIVNGMKQMDDMPLKDSLMLARMMDTVVKENTPPNKK